MSGRCRSNRTGPPYSVRVSTPARTARATARRDVGAFLASRRARVSPGEAGLAPGVGRRRVKGLRREEVALLAGISVEYYSRLERGHVGAVSDAVLDSLARVLRLDELERAHLTELVRTAGGSPTGARTGSPSTARPELAGLLDVIGAPAFVRNARLDILAANPLARVLYAHVFEVAATGDDGTCPNLARSLFLDPRSRTYYLNWDRLADNAAGTFRIELARSPGDRDLARLVERLLAESEEFRARWSAHAVDRYGTGEQEFNHELVGELTLRYEALEVVADPGLTLLVYHAAPGSADAAALSRLSTSI